MKTVLVVAPMLLAACAIDAGQGFGTIEDAQLTASFEPGGRLFDDGSFLVMGGYRVTPESMALEVIDLRLDELVTSGGGAGGVFDPANPPPGYSLCHAGHCHHEDGRLVDYESIQAELSSGGSSEYVTRVTMPLGEELPLLDGSERALTTFLPSRELPEGTISRVQLLIGRFRMTGSVTGGAFGDDVHPIRLDVVVDGALSSLEASREISLDADAAVYVAAGVGVGADFLDGQDLSSELEDGAVVIDRGPIADAVALRVLSTPLEADLQ